MDILHDLHLHTTISRCAREGATPEAYMEIAKKRGMKTLGFANHVWDTAISPAINDFYAGQDMAPILEMELPKENGLRILRGCEAELDKNGVLGLSEEAAKKLDYVLCVHSHSQFDAINQMIDTTHGS